MTRTLTIILTVIFLLAAAGFAVADSFSIGEFWLVLAILTKFWERK